MPGVSSKVKKKKETKKVLKKKRVKKAKEEKPEVEKKAEKPVLEQENEEKYWEAVGRRKTSVARARLFARGKKEFLVNTKSYQEYFPTLDLEQTAVASLNKMKILDRFRILVKVKGGGYHSQAEAVRHSIARALVKFNPNFRKRLKKAGYLTRDPRMRERKKFGLKRARRAPQWSKR